MILYIFSCSFPGYAGSYENLSIMQYMQMKPQIASPKDQDTWSLTIAW